MSIPRAVALAFALAALGCPPSSSSSSGATGGGTPQACTHEGDRCTYSDGKIGLCTAKPGACEGTACLTCMSLH